MTSPAFASRLNSACMIALLAVACVRVSCSHDSFPGWSGDPFHVLNPILGITPRISAVLDVIALSAAGVILATERVRPLLGGCLLATAAAVLVHGLQASTHRLDNAMLGLTWLSGMASAVAMVACCHRPERRALAMACLASVFPLLAFKGVHQYFVEHRETLAAFLAEKDRFLEAQGWAPGSAMALGYERRLSQPESTGWFGLANVYASMAAAALVLGVGALLPAFVRPSQVWKRTGAVLLAVLGAGMLGAAGAKGGIAAALLGIGLLVVTALARKRPASQTARRRVAAVLAVACLIGPLSLVVIRGFIGTAWGELSLLFRWFYLRGATAIISDHWLMGTGPAGFRDAYVIAKPPLAPEDVTSPHSVLFDYAATLGLGGIAAGAIVFAMMLGAARTCMLPASGLVDAGASLRPQIRVAAVPLVTAVMVGAMLEQAIQTPAMALLRVMAMGCGLLMAGTILSVARHAMASLGVAFAAAALALSAHAQIEMTLVTPGSVCLIMCMLGVAASAPEPEPIRRPEAAARMAHVGRFAAATPCLAAVALVGVMAPGLFDWERSLRRAYDHAATVAEFQSRIVSMERSVAAREDSPVQLLEDLASLLGAQVPPTSEGIAAGMTKLRARAMSSCLGELEAAVDAQPDHFATNRVLSRLLLDRGVAQGSASDDARRAIELTRAAARRAGTSVAWSWHATCLLALDPNGHREEAVDSLRQAASLAPREPSHAVRLARLLEATDRLEAAAWAAHALACDDNLRLDPLLQMPASEREALRAMQSLPVSR